jgi:hypothetical protein
MVRMFTFLIDEVYAHDLFSDVDDYSQSISSYTDLIEESTRGELREVLYTSDFYKKNVNGKSSADIFFSDESSSGEYRDEFLRFTQLLNRLDTYNPVDYLSESDAEEDFQFYISSGEHLGLLSDNDYSGCTWWSVNTQLISSVFSPREYCRYHLARNINDEDILWRVFSDLFPKIYLNTDSSRLKVSNLGFPIRDSFSWVVSTLSYLNDHGIVDFQKGNKDFIQSASAKNIELSPESPKTHNSKDKMKKREISVSSMKVCCEWHAKYRFDKGRIHFHIGQGLSPEILKHTDSKVIVGIFCEHLPT